jgi:hypothetical protein
MPGNEPGLNSDEDSDWADVKKRGNELSTEAGLLRHRCVDLKLFEAAIDGRGW